MTTSNEDDTRDDAKSLRGEDAGVTGIAGTEDRDPAEVRLPGGFPGMEADEGTAETVDMLARFRDGDVDAFQAVVGEYEARLVQFFYRLCWDRGRAEDFTQDLFLKLLRGAQRYQPQGRLSTFIFRVATNLWIDFYRSMKPRGRLYSLDQVMLTGEPIVKSSREQAAPGDRLIVDEEKQQLRDAMASLTEPHRIVLELAIYQEMPYAQIGVVLDIPVGTVKSRMHNCVRALRAHLTEKKGREAGSASPRFPNGATGVRRARGRRAGGVAG